MSTHQSFASKNGRLTVVVDAQIPPSLLQLLFGDESDGSNKSTIGSVGGSSSSAAGRDAPATNLLLHNVIYAPSIDSNYLVIGYADRYMLLERPKKKDELNYRLMSVGNEGAASGEKVTALYCMDIYAAHNGSKQPSSLATGGGQSMCVIVGYSSGYMRIFSMYGHLLTAHQFHTQPLLRIRVRMPSQANSEQTAGEVRYLASSGYSSSAHRRSNDGVLGGDGIGASILQGPVREDAEEVCLTYADGVMVSIDGKSLYLALRLCLNEA
ncbi:Rab3 GTPase-activating protein non-catalytic subunit, partial [Coemansia erecta]